jgi:predicted ATPase
MAEVWTQHDRIARDLLPAHGGREIDKTDGMLMLFADPAAAVSFTLAYHRALAGMATPLRARAGIHVGPVILRENSAADVALGAKPLEVEGLAKPTTARVMAIARGGQTLLTPEAREALGKTELRVESHGHWMVKGVADPIELFEIAPPGLRPVAPADTEKAYRVIKSAEWWMPVRDIPNNLPHQATSFVGRDIEIDEVEGFLAKARLVTLLGMGGLGKTRLALQVAAERLSQFPDGAWFIDLAPLRDEALVIPHILQVLGAPQEPDRPPLQSLCSHLRGRRTLLLIDNCEHLLRITSNMVAAVLQAAPHVRLLATSREALHVPGEQSYPLRPLPVPARGATGSAVGLSPAVQLFVDRARQHKPSFELGPAETPVVAELVERLEGIPLALELAAARIRVLPVAEINSRLKDRYKILTGGARVLQERQQTLRALVDWSYDLLDPREQCTLARLGIFVGGFDLAAAEAVCGDDPLAPEDMLDLLGSLVEKSLVMLDEHDEVGRYRMLETIRDYASEKLVQSGGLDAVALRHCDYYFARAKEARKGMLGPEQAVWIRRTETDLDNLRAATALALGGGADAFVAVKLAVAMQTFWTLRGYASEGRRVIRDALALPAIQDSDLAQAWALYVGASLAESQSDHAEARQMLETCLTLRRKLENPVDIAATLSTLALARLQGGDAEGARAAEEEALALFRQIGDQYGEAIGLLHLGQIAIYLGEHEVARGHVDASLAIARKIKHQELEGAGQLELGELAMAVEDAAEAERWFKRSLTVCREAADKRGEANAEHALGRVALAAKDTAGARARFGDALRAFRSFEMWSEALATLEDCAALAQSDSDPVLAARLLGACASARETLRLARAPTAEREHQARVVALHKQLGSTEFEAQWAEGAAWGVDEAIREALSTEAQRAPA